MLSYNIGVSTRKILTGVRREDPDSSLKSRDVYNYRRKKHVEFLNRRTPIQALLMALPEEGNWIFNYQLEDSNEDESSPLSALFAHINLPLSCFVCIPQPFLWTARIKQTSIRCLYLILSASRQRTAPSTLVSRLLKMRNNQLTSSG